MPRASVLVDELANELDSWPGVRIERPLGGPAVVFYENLELGVLDRDRGLVELHFSEPERDALVERGDAAPAPPVRDSENVSHAVRGPADFTAALELFDRRYRELRGEDEPYSSRDPG